MGGDGMLDGGGQDLVLLTGEGERAPFFARNVAAIGYFAGHRVALLLESVCRAWRLVVELWLLTTSAAAVTVNTHIAHGGSSDVRFLANSGTVRAPGRATGRADRPGGLRIDRSTRT